MTKNFLGGRGRMTLKENVTYRLKDAQGNFKKMFALNKVGRAIMEAAREGYTPYHADGSVKNELRASLALYGLRIPFLTGSWMSEMQVSNGVTTVGKALVAGRINASGAPAAATYIAVGTGTTAFNAADTTLQTETSGSGLDRAAASASLVTTDTTNDTAQLVVTFTVTGTVAVTESGVLNAASTGTLLCRQTFSAINVVNGDSLQITWKIDVD